MFWGSLNVVHRSELWKKPFQNHKNAQCVPPVRAYDFKVLGVGDFVFEKLHFCM